MKGEKHRLRLKSSQRMMSEHLGHCSCVSMFLCCVAGISREPGIQRRKRQGPGAAQFGTAPLYPSGPDSDAQGIEASAGKVLKVHCRIPLVKYTVMSTVW